ncbi:MAG: GIY-YIG nuclease family protein [Candidatus Levybacteria bacterium]|nr:GIY-YIG nuclease family protein [Candidatus Levybacteria bacterium]
MFVVYILKNSISGKHYIGSTNDLERRLSEHNRGHTKSTRRKGAWEVIHTEQFIDSLTAKRRERLIKSYKGGNAFKKLIAGFV